MIRPIFAASVLTVVLSASASAQADKYHITPQEHAACDDDVIRLCGDVDPDEDKLLSCMKSRRAGLSPACSALFDAGLRKRHMKL